VWWCTILLEDYVESVWVEDCKGKTFSVMPFVHLETKPPETLPLFFGHSVFLKAWNI
jgi:hypothetical protein